MNKKLLVFGGSFNPVHNGHKSVLESAINQIHPDKVLLIPNYQSPFKEEVKTSVEQKLEMLKIFLNDFVSNLVEIDEFEINKQESSYFIYTLEYLKQKYFDYDIYLLIGSDQLVNFDKWYQYEEILNNIFSLVVAKRKVDRKLLKQAKPFIAKYQNKIIELKNFKSIDISSTAIRTFKVKPTDLNLNVLKYINDNGIYAIERLQHYCSPERFKHAFRVAWFASELCNKHNLDKEMLRRAQVAATYHDIAKNLDDKLQIKLFKKTKYHPMIPVKTMHGYVGAYILEKDFLFNDSEILNAIRRHTLPFTYFESKPTLLDKIIYISDKLEMFRTDDDVVNQPISYFRDLAFKDIDNCFDELYKDLTSCVKTKK